MRARLVSNRYAIGYCSVSLHGTLNQQYCSLAALARERPWLPPGVVLRAANQNQNDCRWQSYLDLLAVERSETDEDRRSVSIMNVVRKKGTILKAVPSYLSAFRIRGCRRSSSAPFGGTFPPCWSAIFSFNSPMSLRSCVRRLAMTFFFFPLAMPQGLCYTEIRSKSTKRQ